MLHSALDIRPLCNTPIFGKFLCDMPCRCYNRLENTGCYQMLKGLHNIYRSISTSHEQNVVTHPYHDASTDLYHTNRAAFDLYWGGG